MVKKAIIVLSLLIGSLFNVFAKELSIENFELIDKSFLEIRFNDGNCKYLKISPELKEKEERWVGFDFSYNFKKYKFNILLIGEKGNLAELLINKFTTKGNIKNQDWVELECIQDGFLDGISVRYNDNLLILEGGYIKRGETIKLIFTDGLSNNKGYIDVCSTKSPYSRVIDRVEYRNEDNCNDFKKNNMWSGKGINIKESSTKRPIIRKRDKNMILIDTNCADDFYI